MDRNSSVGIVIRFGLDDPGITIILPFISFSDTIPIPVYFGSGLKSLRLKTFLEETNVTAIRHLVILSVT